MTTKKTRGPGLRQLEELLLSGVEHAAIAMHPRMCDANTIGAVVRDIAALANLRVRGHRLVVFGVSKTDTGVALDDITEAEHSFGAKLERSATKYLEPQLRLRYLRWRIRSKSLGVLLVENCDDTPYLIRKDAAPITQVGDAWIRRRNRSARMRRGELDKLYTEKLEGPLYDGRVRVQFAGDTPSEFVRLTVAKAAELPSRIAAEKIEALIGARQLAMNAATNQLTYIGRLSQARIMGCDTPYSDKGLATLNLELKAVAEAHRADDEHFRFEQQAQSVNLQLVLEGDGDIECASLILHIPANVGITIPNDNGAATHEREEKLVAGNPHVEFTRDVIRVSENYERLPARRSIAAFRRPLRVVVDAAAAGHKIPVHYRLHGRNLRYPVSGKLYIICAA